MSTKKKAGAAQPSLDTMTLRDLASLFALSGVLAARDPEVTLEPKMAAVIADLCADAWIARRPA